MSAEIAVALLTQVCERAESLIRLGTCSNYEAGLSLIQTGETLLGSFLERSKRWVVYVTDRRIIAIDVGRRMIRSLVTILLAAFAYLGLFAVLIPVVLDINIYLPLLIIVAFFPFLYVVARSAQHRKGDGSTGAKKVFEVDREQIAEFEISNPSVVTGWGKLVVRTQSLASTEFRIVGKRQFRQVNDILDRFCLGSPIRMTVT